jgi:LysM repeat protein
LGLAVVLFGAKAGAFAHVIRPGETLAQIAERVYGDAQLERVLVGANALDTQGGTVIVPGMRLEIPAPGQHTVIQGESWAELSLAWLGSSDIARIELLSLANKGVPWVQPVEGQEIEIPAVLTYIAGDNETVHSIAQRFWGDPNRGWEINVYNRREAVVVRRGEAVLVPMARLRLTDAGRAEARATAQRDGASAGMALEQQRRADVELPALLADLRAGSYVAAVARGNRLLGSGGLTHQQLAAVHRALVDAYVALDAPAEAAAACAAWRSSQPSASLDRVRVSPKVLAACAER